MDIRGAKIDHQPGDQDDFANAAAGAIWLMLKPTVNEAGWLEYAAQSLAAQAMAEGVRTAPPGQTTRIALR